MGVSQNTPNESTGEKPCFLLYGFDCHTPTEAAYLPPTPPTVTDVLDYRAELVRSLSSARKLAATSIQEAQKGTNIIMISQLRVFSILLGLGVC